MELKTHLNSEIEKVVPNAKEHHKLLQQYVDDLLDQRVAKTDMKLRHIITKGIEVNASLFLVKKKNCDIFKSRSNYNAVLILC